MFGKPSYIFFEKSPISNGLSFFYSPSDILRQKCYFRDFEKFQHFFPNKPKIFPEKPNFRTILRNLIFQWHSTTNLLYLKNFENLQIFFRKNHFFSPEIIQIFNVLRILTSSVAFYRKFVTFGDLKKTFCVEKVISFQEKPELRTFWEYLQFRSHSAAILPPAGLLKITRFFSENLSNFPKNPKC